VDSHFLGVASGSSACSTPERSGQARRLGTEPQGLHWRPRCTQAKFRVVYPGHAERRARLRPAGSSSSVGRVADRPLLAGAPPRDVEGVQAVWRGSHSLEEVPRHHRLLHRALLRVHAPAAPAWDDKGAAPAMHWSRAPAAVARRSLTFFTEAWPVVPSITSSVSPFARRSRRAGESSTIGRCVPGPPLPAGLRFRSSSQLLLPTKSSRLLVQAGPRPDHLIAIHLELAIPVGSLHKLKGKRIAAHGPLNP